VSARFWGHEARIDPLQRLKRRDPRTHANPFAHRPATTPRSDRMGDAVENGESRMERVKVKVDGSRRGRIVDMYGHLSHDRDGNV